MTCITPFLRALFSGYFCLNWVLISLFPLKGNQLQIKKLLYKQMTLIYFLMIFVWLFSCNRYYFVCIIQIKCFKKISAEKEQLPTTPLLRICLHLRETVKYTKINGNELGEYATIKYRDQLLEKLSTGNRITDLQILESSRKNNRSGPF